MGTLPSGIHVPLVTPFGPDGEVALAAIEGLAHAAIDAGAAGIVALGTTGESATLDADERRAVIEACSRVCAERGTPLTVGAGGSDTRATARELAELEKLPAVAAALVPVPSFTRPSGAGVVAHFSRLTALSGLPLVVYHIPYRTGQSLDSVDLLAISRMPGIAGIKFAVGGIDQSTIELMAGLSGDSDSVDSAGEFSVFAGDDVYLSPLLALGADGGILASAHVATARFVDLADAWRRGDVRRARLLGHRLAKLSAAMFREPNPTVVKGLLHARGLIPTPDVRLPLLPASRESIEAAEAAAAAVEAG